MVQSVIKRDGKRQAFNPQKILEAVNKAAREILPQKDSYLVAKEVLNTCLHIIKKYKKSSIHIEEIQDIVEESLMKKGYPQIAKAYILYRRYREEIRLVKEKLGIVKDELKLSINAIRVLQERYLLKNEDRKVIETPLQMFERVASYVAEAENNFSSKNKNFFRDKFFKILTSLEFLPNSPTLMNAKTSLGQLSACFVLPVKDSIEEIFSSLKAMALIHQSGGGTGFSFSNLRPKQDIVFSTKGIASGPVSFMQVFDAATKVILQGGKRRGANMAVLRIDHPDIVELIEAKLKEGILENFNLSVGITDNFMHALKYNKYIELINPRNKKVVKKIKTKDLFSLISYSAYSCGDPGLIFLDTINRFHPIKGLGEIEATNPCGEVPLLNYEACNLGSINLAKFVNNKKVDWLRLKEAIELGVRFLDNVIEVNNFPLKEIKEATLRTRKIGLGVMGFADMLIKLRIPYNSFEAVNFAKRLMRFIRKVSMEASCKLGEERGVFLAWKNSIYYKKKLKLRNATLNSIAPTGSISIIANCSSGIEPIFALSYTRNILGGIQFFEFNPLLEEVAIEEGLYSKRLINRLKGEISLKRAKNIPLILKNIFVTAFDISPLDHLKIQASFQEFTDNAVSKTINLAQNASIEDIANIYLKAYELNLKGITVYRYGSKKEQVLMKETYPKEEIFVEPDYSGGCFQRVCSI